MSKIDFSQIVTAEARVAVLRDAVEGMKALAVAAKAAKAAKDSGGATTTEETTATDSETPAVTASDSVESLVRAAAGPVGKAASMIANGATLTPEDAAAIRALAGVVGTMLKAVAASEQAA